jgi:hypothetical protein
VDCSYFSTTWEADLVAETSATFLSESGSDDGRIPGFSLHFKRLTGRGTPVLQPATFCESGSDTGFSCCVFFEDSGSSEKYRGSSFPSGPRGGRHQIHLENRNNANYFWVALPISLLGIAC